MKNSNMIYASILSLALGVSAFASDGSGAKGGGDIELIRQDEISAYLTDPSQLKSDLIAYFSNLKLETVTDETIRTELSFMIAGGVTLDIQLSAYQPLNDCTDKNEVEHSASTVTGQKAADVCFNLKHLATLGAKKSEMIGLAAHEEARHFGFEDTIPGETHPIGAFVAEHVKLTAETESNTEASMVDATADGTGDSYKESCKNAFALATSDAKGNCELSGLHPKGESIENILRHLPGDGCRVQAIIHCE